MSAVVVPRARAGFVSPYERFSELVFGLIMTLSVTGSLAVASELPGGTREMLVAAVGCNIAWGLVDAVMYLLNQLLERSRNRLLVAAMAASTQEESRKVLLDVLPGPLGSVLTVEELSALRQKLIDGRFPAASQRLTRDDFLAALGIFLWVAVGTLPVALPFAFLQDLYVAMRVSNGIALLLLFVLGLMVGRYSGTRPILSGGVLLLLGVALVSAVIALGG
ncbi:MAG: VIT1/CCC1 transporter family protein [Myxococcales bacterium]|nr:VIT1/CCC1 transporter family protein [Myxococcales bacterium]